MDQFGKIKTSLKQTVYSSLKFFMGLLCVTSLVVTLFLSLPVFLFRLIIKYVARLLKPECGSMLDGQSSFLVTDFFSKSPPRANIVVALVIRGRVTLSELKERVLKAWIHCNYSDAEKKHFEKFCQYPVCWFGFPFWRNARSTFNIDHHVTKLENNGSVMNRDELQNHVDILLNQHFPEKQSPWQYFLVENYEHLDKKKSEDIHCAILLKWHHCLSDGLSMQIAALKVIDDKFTMSDLKLPQINNLNQTSWQTIWFWLTFPIAAVLEGSMLMSHILTTSRFKVSDRRKAWYQISALSEPIPLQKIKEIKNSIGVSFSSVLLYALSSTVNIALSKHICPTESNTEKLTEDSVLCAAIIPLNATRKPGLINFATAAIFKLPVDQYSSQLDHICAINNILLTTRRTVIPYLIYYFCILVGYNFQFVSRILAKNKVVPIGLTNVSGFPNQIEDSGRIIEAIFMAAGALQGNMGFCFGVVSHNNEIRIQLVAEQALMTREQAELLVRHAVNEILKLEQLENICNNSSSNKLA